MSSLPQSNIFEPMIDPYTLVSLATVGFIFSMMRTILVPETRTLNGVLVAAFVSTPFSVACGYFALKELHKHSAIVITAFSALVAHSVVPAIIHLDVREIIKRAANNLVDKATK